MKGSLFIFIYCPLFCAILGIDYGQQFTKAVLLAPGVPFEIVLTDEGRERTYQVYALEKYRIMTWKEYTDLKWVP